MNEQDPHREIRRRYRIARRYWMRRGLKPDAGGSMTISWEMEEEAMAAHEKEHGAEGQPEPPREPFCAGGKFEPVAPGSGELVVAVLCPGPSLKETWPKGGRLDGYDVVIAVNNAVEHAPCEWWMVWDAKPLQEYEGRPSVGICTSGGNIEALTKGRNIKPKALSEEELEKLCLVTGNKLAHADAPRRAGFSTITGIVLAARMGARRIDLFGDDKEGRVYYDGRENKATKQGRWDREKREQEPLVEALANVNVTVQHINPTAEG